MDLSSPRGSSNHPTALHPHPMESHLHIQIPLAQAAPELTQRDLKRGRTCQFEVHDVASMCPQAGVCARFCIAVACMRQNLGCTQHEVSASHIKAAEQIACSIMLLASKSNLSKTHAAEFGLHAA